MAQTRDALLDLKMEQMQQNRISTLQTQIQSKLLQNQRDRAVGGGIDQFLDVDAMDKAREGFSDKLNEFVNSSNIGDRQNTARAGLGLNRNVKGFLGGAELENPQLRRLAIQGRSENIREEAGFRIKELSQAINQLTKSGKFGQAQSLRVQLAGLKGVQARSGEIATQQVLGEVKTRRLPEEIANMVAELKLLNAEQSKIDVKMGDSLKAAIQASNMPNLLGQIHQAAININNSVLQQQMQERLNEAKTDVETKKEKVSEAKKSLKEGRKAARGFGGEDVKFGGLSLQADTGDVSKFTYAMEDIAKVAVREKLLAPGAGVGDLAKLSEQQLANIFSNLTGGSKQVLLQGGGAGFGERAGGAAVSIRSAGNDMREIFEGLSKDTSGFGASINKIISATTNPNKPVASAKANPKSRFGNCFAAADGFLIAPDK